jgi:uncharacterized protein YjbI with pentapeptide repeats
MWTSEPDTVTVKICQRPQEIIRLSEPTASEAPVADEGRDGLRADCERCFGLCCVAPAFAASADFAIDKPAGHACPHLTADFRCGIHDRLRTSGFPGCAAYDCFGAGQKVAQVTFGGRDWRRAPHLARAMFDAFTVMRHLHELLWHLTEARALPPARPLRGELGATLDNIERLTRLPPDELLALDLATLREEVGMLLGRASELARAGAGRHAIDRRGADLIGADLRGADLRGANLRGAYLIGADIAGADLRSADLIGADLRGADLGGADLTGAIFLTQAQVDSARGDVATRLPARLDRPAHWRSGPAKARPS